MSKWTWTLLLVLLSSTHALAQEPKDTAAQNDSTKPKTLSGMSILGNEETPKSLVIVPWKSSEIGEDVSLTDTLDDRALPVDKEVFLRELRFYEIRSREE
jgi:hypothetical protein